MAIFSALACLITCTIISVQSTSDASFNKRELPISYSCDPRIGTCSKGDLISNDIATCKKEGGYILSTCTPINDHFLSSVVDVPDVSTGVDCVADSSLPITCGTTDTRCVCDKAVDITRPAETLANHCRCQYWPEVDDHANQHSYCTQYDHGGDTGTHFYTCCNNCNDLDRTCDGQVYQGGGVYTNEYCSTCGQNSNRGGGRATYHFNCLSCYYQATCDSYCSGLVLRFVTRITPGLCPAWAACFRGCCLESKSSRRKRGTNGALEVGEFCGDFTCQSGEDHTSCPTDCCPDYNPDDCSQNTCNPDCCYEHHCCTSSAAGVASPYSRFTAFLLLTAGALSSFMFCF